MKTAAQSFVAAMEAQKDENRIPGAMRFFKTAKGQYGEGDLFWGLSVPTQQKIGKEYKSLLDLKDLEELIRHPVHEIRLTTLYIMVLRYRSCKEDAGRQELVELYLRSLQYINNWDLVDSSAAYILGAWYLDRDHTPLLEMAKSDHLWTQRVSIIATHFFIRNGRYDTTLKIAKILLHHKHDLIHKAVGWMLREIGNKDLQTERKFLDRYYQEMPRTMLRYAIEKFEEPLRQDYLKGRV